MPECREVLVLGETRRCPYSYPCPIPCPRRESPWSQVASKVLAEEVLPEAPGVRSGVVGGVLNDVSPFEKVLLVHLKDGSDLGISAGVALAVSCH